MTYTNDLYTRPNTTPIIADVQADQSAGSIGERPL